jgi:hypothetical protein
MARETSMVTFFLRLFLAIITMRVLFGLIRAVARVGAGDPDERLGSGNGTAARKRDRGEPKPLVDRASAIDVPFTEERTDP